MAQDAPRSYTYEEYLALEAHSDVKHEFYDGAILAMAGGSREHSLLKTNLLRRVANALDGRPCRAFDADLRSLVEEANFATYPDVAVACPPAQWSPRDRNALTNPTVLCEVSSPSTAAYDIGEKFDQYARFASLQEYVLVDSERVGVRLFRREGEVWTLHRYGAGDVVALQSIDVRLLVDEIYDGWAELRASGEVGAALAAATPER